MKVREILDAKGRGVVTVRPEATVTTALDRLVRDRIGALVVSEDGHHVAGVLSERDLVRALAAEGAALVAGGRRVAELMTREVATCAPEDDVGRVMAEMTRRRVRHLPVVEGGGLAGIVSIGDVVKSRLGEAEEEAATLRDTHLPSSR
jgi:CBS domain-containing protein